jgi:hypothetical protein
MLRLQRRLPPLHFYVETSTPRPFSAYNLTPPPSTPSRLEYLWSVASVVDHIVLGVALQRNSSNSVIIIMIIIIITWWLAVQQVLAKMSVRSLEVCKMDIQFQGCVSF